MFLLDFVLYLFVLCIAIGGLSIEEQQEEEKKRRSKRGRSRRGNESCGFWLLSFQEEREKVGGGVVLGEGEEVEKSEMWSW